MSSRIDSIDTVRGVALLGLLTMNLVGMSMPIGAYLSPLAVNADGFMNDVIYSIFYVFADQKFMGMFSLLFGASVMLLIEKIKDAGGRAWLVHYVRNGWLLLIGLAHGVLLWEGDVLLLYAVIALFIYPMHRSQPATLFLLFAVLFLATIYYSSGLDLSNPLYSEEDRAELLQIFSPSIDQLQGEIDLMLGSYSDFVAYRTGDLESTSAMLDFDITFFVSTSFRALSMMCLGIALYKIGFVQGSFSTETYQKIFWLCLLVGLPIIIFGLISSYYHNFDMEHYFSNFGGFVLNTIGSVFMVLAYISGVNWWCKGNLFCRLQGLLANVGRMALSNYLLQSLIGTSIFYGYGLGLYGQLDRWHLLLIMFCIWGFQLALSHFWLGRFRQGPVEYLWRCLTYFKFPPFIK